MKNQKIRTVIPFVVVVCLALLGLFSIIRIPVYMDARNLVISATGDDAPDWGLVMDVGADFVLMNKMGSYVGIEDLRLNEDGTITYIDSNSETKIRKDPNGNIVQEFWEGDLYNELTLTPTGKLFLDGKEVTVGERVVGRVSLRAVSALTQASP